MGRIKKMAAVLDESMSVSDEDLTAVLSPRHATHLLLSVCLKKKKKSTERKTNR